MLRFHSNQNALALALVEVVDPDLPNAGDMRFRISVTCEGFTGRGEAWIRPEVWACFRAGLRELESGEGGSVVLESIAPEQLRLAVHAQNSTPEVTVSGRLSTPEGGQGASTSLAFSFSPDVAQLKQAAESAECMSWR